VEVRIVVEQRNLVVSAALIGVLLLTILVAFAELLGVF
jgi:hypothetical protein